MKKAILGKKLGMTQIFDESGKVIPVTAIEAGPCTVVQIKTKDTDGYEAVKLGFGDVKENKLIKLKQMKSVVLRCQTSQKIFRYTQSIISTFFVSFSSNTCF